MTTGPDPTVTERNVLVRLFKRGHCTLGGLREGSMSAAGARAYIQALCDRADQAEREQRRGAETDGR